MRPKEKLDTANSFVKMEEARKLMDQGNYQESLVLALEALLEELDVLRESLTSLPMGHTDCPGLTLDTREELADPDYYWLPPMKPRVLH